MSPLRAVAVRLHQRETKHLTAAQVVAVPSTVEAAPEGYIVTMVDGYGEPVEQVFLDLEERVLRRVPLTSNPSC